MKIDAKRFWGRSPGDACGCRTILGDIPFHKGNLLKWGNFAKITIPQVTGMNHWIVIALIRAVMIRLILMIEKKDERAS